MSGVAVGEEDKKERRIPLRGNMHSAENTRQKKKCLLRLKQQEYLIERNLASAMENMKLEPEVLRSVSHDMSDIARNRQIFLDGVTKSLKEIIDEVRSVKSVMDRPDDIRNLDTKAYKQRLVGLSRKIRDFKAFCRMQASSQERTALEYELREFESNLHKYESAINSNNLGKPTSVASSSVEGNRRHDYKEIRDFHALIAKTGHTHNWSDEDHLLFLKMRRKCGSIPALVAAVQDKCPDLTVEAVVNHEAWYKVYLELRQKQRSTVREWRERKETERTKKMHEATLETATLEEASPREKVNTDIAGEIFHMTDKCEKSISKTKNADNSAKKELVKQWRTEKENKHWMDEEQSRILAESKLAAHEKRRRERFERVQEALQEYREKKLERCSKISEKVSRPKYNSTLITAFRKQDVEYTNNRKNLIERSRRPTKNRTRKIVGLQVAKKRDYSTLLNSTKVWTEKCKMQDSAITNEPKKLQYIKDVPRLYIQRRNQESMEIKDALAFF